MESNSVCNHTSDNKIGGPICLLRVDYRPNDTKSYNQLIIKVTKKLNWLKTKFALTCSFQKVIRALAFSGRKKFGYSFYLTILGIV